MSETLLDTASAGGVLTLTLRGGRAHPLSLGMIEALHAALDHAIDAPDIRVIVLHGPGPIFCAGHDLKEIARHRGDADGGAGYLTRLFGACAEMMQRLATSPKPTLAMVEGIATAAGLQLLASCDLVLAGEAARFCLPGVRNGGFCTTPAVAVSRVIGRRHLMELLLSGEDRDAAWALRAGLVTELVAPNALAARVAEVAATLATRNPRAIASGKAAVLAQMELDLAAAYALATPVMIEHFLDPARGLFERDPLFRSG